MGKVGIAALALFFMVLIGFMWHASQDESGATPDQLAIGDSAPALQLQEWIQGAPITLADGRDMNVFVIEFWATWCGPCLESAPHLTQLQATYADAGVVVIGVADIATLNQSPSEIQAFVQQMGGNMSYRIAIDEGQSTHDAYVKGIGSYGLPWAFIVDKQGRIAWAGLPLSGLDMALAYVLAGEPPPPETFAFYRKLTQSP